MSLQALSAEQATWYLPATNQTKDNITTRAYHTAVDLLKKELGVQPGSKVPEDNFASIDEVCATIVHARKQYTDSSKSHKGVQAWLKKLSSRIMHYKGIMDSLSQHHPEYVALAWGTIKLILMGIINHATMVEELAKALVDIADKLPQAHLNVDLYRTNDMEAALSRLYACLLMFFRLCARWYNKGSWGRLWSSLKDPYELKCKDLVKDIEVCSELVEDLANAGARVELRDIHNLTEAQHAILADIDANIRTASEAQARMVDSIDKNVLNVMDGQTRLEVSIAQVNEIVTSSQTTLNQMQRAVFRLEFHHILDYFTPEVLPGQGLRKVQALTQRRPVMSDVQLEKTLRDWVNASRSSVIVLCAGTIALKQANELAADVVNHLQRNTPCVFWSISGGSVSQKLTLEDIFKSIIYQSLQQCGPKFSDFGEQLHPQKIHGSHTDSEWVDLICLLLTQLPRVFIILETKSLRNMYGERQDWIGKLLGHLKKIVDRTAGKCQLKILLLLYGAKTNVASGTKPSQSVRILALRPQTEIPPRLKRKVGQTGLSTKGWEL